MTRSSAGRVLRRVSHPGICEEPVVTHRRSGERLFDEPSRLKGNPQRRSSARLGLAIGEAFAAYLDAESERHSPRRQRKCDLEVVQASAWLSVLRDLLGDGGERHGQQRHQGEPKGEGGWDHQGHHHQDPAEDAQAKCLASSPCQ